MNESESDNKLYKSKSYNGLKAKFILNNNNINSFQHKQPHKPKQHSNQYQHQHSNQHQHQHQNQHQHQHQYRQRHRIQTLQQSHFNKNKQISDSQISKNSSAEKIFNNRYQSYQKQMNFNIHRLQDMCEKYYDGLENNIMKMKIIKKEEMLNQKEIKMYDAKVLPKEFDKIKKNFSLPKIMMKNNNTEGNHNIIDKNNNININKNIKKQSKTKSISVNNFNYHKVAKLSNNNTKQQLQRSYSKNESLNINTNNIINKINKNDDLINKALNMKELNISNKQISSFINQVRKNTKGIHCFVKIIKQQQSLNLMLIWVIINDFHLFFYFNLC